jgi:hypothetical protein
VSGVVGLDALCKATDVQSISICGDALVDECKARGMSGAGRIYIVDFIESIRPPPWKSQIYLTKLSAENNIETY